MIHIIVYSTTNTAAKMYKKKKKTISKQQEKDGNGWDSCTSPQRLWESQPNSRCRLCIWWLVVFAIGRNIKF